MTDERTLIFVGAHPDDESFGPGGTLSRYAAEGVKVVYACGTRGEAGTVDPQDRTDNTSLGERRWAELLCAASRLGLGAVIHLGYRDSGMPGSPDAAHPRALVSVPIEAVIRDIVAVLREVRPQVVVTFDPIGGYYHPDHIVVHNATVRAFHLAGDAVALPDAGAPFAPQKLYFWVPSRRALKLAVGALRLIGRDPAHVGRNADVDLARAADVDFPIHARIRVSRRALARKHAAVRCHQSQADSTLTARLRRLLSECFGQTDGYTRAHPRAGAGLRETDLFQGIA
jgi:LmbE family N-acetylglucosaminyl deacetylase